MLKFSRGTPKRSEMRLPLRIALAVSAVLAVSAPAALADTVQSSNWAGYAVHRAGVRFKKVVAAWKQPRVNCSQYSPGYSAVWVGLGGFSSELPGARTDRDRERLHELGRAVSSAWYELVPAPSRGVQMRVSAGDSMIASVTVSGQRAHARAPERDAPHDVPQDAARVSDRPVVSRVDRRSAVGVREREHLPDAPARRLRLHNVRARRNPDHEWAHRSDRRRSRDTTKIKLSPSGRRFVLNGGGATDGAATPSGLTGGGSSFKVTFQSAAIQASPIVRAAAAAVPGGYILHAVRG